MNQRTYLTILLAAAFAVVFAPARADACQPVPAFMYVFMGPNQWGVMTLVGLIVVVFFKCLLFSRWSGLPGNSSWDLMFSANVYSTIPGLLGALMMAQLSTVMFLGAGISVVVLLYFPSKSIAGAYFKNSGTLAVMMLFIFAIVVSLIFLGLSQESAYSADSNLPYWALKYVYATLAVSVGLGVSIGFEYSSIMARVKKKFPEAQNLMPAVARANLYGMLISVGIAALVTLPIRLSSPDFLYMVNLMNILRDRLT